MAHRTSSTIDLIVEFVEGIVVESVQYRQCPAVHVRGAGFAEGWADDADGAPASKAVEGDAAVAERGFGRRGDGGEAEGEVDGWESEIAC